MQRPRGRSGPGASKGGWGRGNGGEWWQEKFEQGRQRQVTGTAGNNAAFLSILSELRGSEALREGGSRGETGYNLGFKRMPLDGGLKTDQERGGSDLRRL